MKRYSRFDEILSGQGTGEVTNGCLVIEGGAFRGLHTQGYLDVLMQEGINLSCVIGVSAGALAGINYIAGQIGRSARINIGYRHDGRYVGLRAFLKSRSPVDVGFLTEDRGIIEPLDMERFLHSERRFVAVATNCLTGEPVYFEKGKCGDIMLAARASGSLPYFSPMVMIDGTPYLDGGCAMRLPYQWAIDQGYEKIIVLRTQHLAYRDSEEKKRMAGMVYGKKYPKLADALERSAREYNEACCAMEQLHAEGRILHITPKEPITVSNVESDVEKLGDLYFKGVRDCKQDLDMIRSYLNL